MWQGKGDRWQMTHDMWHMTGGGGEPFLKFKLPRSEGFAEDISTMDDTLH